MACVATVLHVRSRPWAVSGGVKGVDEIFLGPLEVNTVTLL